MAMTEADGATHCNTENDVAAAIDDDNYHSENSGDSGDCDHN